MTRTIRSLALAAACSAVALWGCGHDHGPTKPGAADTKKDGHDHDHDHGDGHDHDEKDGHDHDGHAHAGERHDLGSLEMAGARFAVVQVGSLAGGGEGVFEIAVESGGEGVVALRAWVGAADATGSVKHKIELTGGKGDAHLELPATLPEGSKLWLEVETPGGPVRAGMMVR